MENKKISNSIIILVCLTTAVWSFLLFLEFSLEKPTQSTLNTPQIVDTLQFKDSLLQTIFDLNIEHPYIVYSQAILESDRFNSKLFKENNNLFGMKMPVNRATTAIGIKNGHAVYYSWRECVIDYALFQMAYRRKLTESEYIQKFNTYAEDSLYSQKIIKINPKQRFK